MFSNNKKIEDLLWEYQLFHLPFFFPKLKSGHSLPHFSCAIMLPRTLSVFVEIYSPNLVNNGHLSSWI